MVTIRDASCNTTRAVDRLLGSNRDRTVASQSLAFEKRRRPA
jgi:hypothetical protein